MARKPQVLKLAHGNPGGLLQSVHVGNRQGIPPTMLQILLRKCSVMQQVPAVSGKNSICFYGERRVKEGRSIRLEIAVRNDKAVFKAASRDFERRRSVQ